MPKSWNLSGQRLVQMIQRDSQPGLWKPPLQLGENQRMDKNQRDERRRQEDIALTRGLIWVGAAIVLELLLLLINKYYVNIYSTQESIDTAYAVLNGMKVVRIAALAGGEEPCRLSVMAPASLRAERAFARLCEECRERHPLLLQLKRGGWGEAVEQLARGAVDTAVVLCPPRDSAAGQAALLERWQIARTPLGRQPFALTVAREHPLAEGPLTPERLLEYPCILYGGLGQLEGYFPADYRCCLAAACRIEVEDREVRLRLAAEQVGYLVGIPLHPSQLEGYRLVSRELPGAGCEMALLCRRERAQDPVARRFAQLVCEEMGH